MFRFQYWEVVCYSSPWNASMPSHARREVASWYKAIVRELRCSQLEGRARHRAIGVKVAGRKTMLAKVGDQTGVVELLLAFALALLWVLLKTWWGGRADLSNTTCLFIYKCGVYISENHSRQLSYKSMKQSKFFCVGAPLKCTRKLLIGSLKALNKTEMQ